MHYSISRELVNALVFRLDKEVPNWREVVDPFTLNMAEGNSPTVPSSVYLMLQQVRICETNQG